MVEKINYEILKVFYKYFEKSFNNVSTPEKSLFFPFIDCAEGKRSEILRNSITNPDFENFSEKELDQLVTDALIMPTDETNKYCLTARGLYKIEEYLGLLNIEILLDTAQDKYFSIFSSHEALKDNEKITLFALFSLRCFSENDCFRIGSYDKENEKWMQIFLKCAKFLKELRIIKAIPQSLTADKSYTELPLFKLMRHINHLQKKTKNIYSTTHTRCYFLKVEKDGKLSIEDLTFLFNKIFDRVLEYQEMELIKQFINNISNNELLFLTQHPGKKYSNPEVDMLIEKAIENAVKGL